MELKDLKVGDRVRMRAVPGVCPPQRAEIRYIENGMLTILIDTVDRVDNEDGWADAGADDVLEKLED